MAGRAKEIRVDIKGDADFSAARKDIEADYARIERATKETVADIERAFAGASVEIEVDRSGLLDAERAFSDFTDKLTAGSDVELQVDADQLRRAFDLAEQLDRITADITVETDLSQLQAAEALARQLRSFTGRLDLDVQGTADLREALGIAESLDRVREVKLDVQGRADLDRAEALVRDLDGTSINVDLKVDDSQLQELEQQFAQAGEAGGESFADGFDVTNVGGSLADGLTGLVGAVGPWGAAAAAVGAVFAEDFAAGFESEWSAARGNVILTIRGDLSGAELEDVGRAAGDAYGAGLGESLDSVRDTAALIQQELGDIDSGLDLTEATRQAEALAEVFGVDVVDSVTAVDKLVAQGLVANTREGFNLLAELGKQTGAQFDETLEVTTEFSNALASIGIDGPQGLYLIGTAIEEGIFPQVDQAGEVFEEFAEMLRQGDSVDALEAIGLSAEEMQTKLADGRGAEAMDQIATALLGVEDPARRAALSVEIFGGNMALSSDPDRALELFAQADAIRDVGDGASEAADQLQGTQTNIDKLKLGIQDLGAAAAVGFDAFLGGGLVESSAATVDSLAESFLGIEDASARASGWLDEVSFGLLGASDEAKVLTPLVKDAGDGLGELGEAGADAADGIDDTTLSVEELDAALSAFSGRFTDDQVFRSIEDDAAAAAEAVAGLTSASFDLDSGFDITTESGRKAEAALEDLSGNLDDLIEGYQNGSIAAPDFAAGQAAVEQSVREVASQMGLTEAQTQVLIDTYAAVPDDLNTNVGLTDNATSPLGKVRDKLEELTTVRRATVEVNDNATSPLQKIKDKLDSIRSKTVTVTSVTSSVRALERAVGGPSPAGVPTLVGEEGPELRVFDRPGYIYTAAETRALLANAKVDGPLNTVAPAAGRSGPHINIEQVVVDKGRDLWQDFRLAEDVYAELLR